MTTDTSTDGGGSEEPEDAATQREMAQLRNTLTFTNVAAVLSFAAGGVALLVGGRGASTLGFVCACVYVLINLWVVLVEVPAGIRRSGQLFYADEAEDLWRTVRTTAIVVMVVWGLVCLVLYSALGDEGAGWRFLIGVIMIVLALALAVYLWYMRRLIAVLDASLAESSALFKE
jgi:hypothetical protein